MKMKKFKDYLEKRLTKQEISDIERKAKLELHALKTLQKDVAKAMRNNLTLASIARIFSLLGQKPHLSFGIKK